LFQRVTVLKLVRLGAGGKIEKLAGHGFEFPIHISLVNFSK
jgi:hypothetical protein